MSVRVQKSLKRRTKKPVLRMLNKEEMENSLSEMSETCDNVTYWFDDGGDDTLFGSLVGADEEEEAQELKMQFAILSSDCQTMLQDMYDSSAFPEHFDKIMTFAGNREDDVMEWDAQEGDYFGIEWSWWEQEELEKSLSHLTKENLLWEFRQSFQIGLSYLALRARFDDLSGCAEVLTSDFADRCKVVKRLEELYENVSDPLRYRNAKEWREFDSILQLLPQEEWLK
ncbi:MAG: hypothetical protein IKO41_17860 [Lachnospiraceae bacterium]|nr:hypothetical protein [Lachnospiraceae bacterium]